MNLTKRGKRLAEKRAEPEAVPAVEEKIEETARDIDSGTAEAEELDIYETSSTGYGVIDIDEVNETDDQEGL